MKTFFLLIAGMAFCGHIWGQGVLPSKLLLGGAANFYRNSYTYDDSSGIDNSHTGTFTTMRLAPYLGIKLGEHWLLGPQFGIGSAKQQQYIGSIGENVSNKNTYLQLGLFARRYIGQPKPIQFFVEASYAFTRQKNSSDNDQVLFGSFQDSQDGTLQIAPGLTWAISPRFNLVGRFGRLGFVKGKRKYYDVTNEAKFSYFEFQVNPSTFFFGAEYRFSGKATATPPSG